MGKWLRKVGARCLEIVFYVIVFTLTFAAIGMGAWWLYSTFGVQFAAGFCNGFVFGFLFTIISLTLASYTVRRA